MASHVSMMDDVLISQLPVSMMRAAMRHLVSSCPNGSALLSANVKKQFVEQQGAQLPSPGQLYPQDLETGNTQTLADFLALTRCLFSCHATHECLEYLSRLFKSVSESKLTWTHGSHTWTLLAGISGDAVQAIQAVKEASQRPARTPELLQRIQDILAALVDVSTYCSSHSLPYPFTRAALSVADAQEMLFPSAGTVDRQSFQGPKIQIDLQDHAVNGVHIDTIALGKLSVPRLFNGLWQMSSATAWGSASADRLDDHLLELVQCGFTMTDMADHYGDAELIYGSFRNRLPASIKSRVFAATKWCVFKPLGEPVTRELVLRAVEERCKRLGGRADILQFHWQDHADHDYLKALRYLVELTSSRPDLVSEIGLVNFNASDTELACEYMLQHTGSVGFVSNQVQFSLIDSRPLYALCGVCERYGVKLLTYGSYCGGFLSDRWLDKPTPDIYNPSAKLTPSQRKYFDSINEWGSWAEFQDLLRTLKQIGDRKGVSISNVAARWVLQQPAVGSVIVGTRLGVSSNAEQNLDTFSVTLDKDDLEQIEKVASAAKGRSFFERIGDCGAEYH